ncbi:MAG: trypsin-like serine protease [Labilithrix sp.]|nr:trypsin-like serine protease [Labilithrix sp.]MCW5817149.1 trypsin-like serine protease [Labilithrix sp.]
MLARLLGASLALVAVAACGDQPEEVTSDRSNLIGGAYLGEGDLPSTLRIKNSCTAAKVGPRHILTAAHCVYNRGLKPAYATGARIEVSSAVRQTATSAYLPLTIKQTHVAPEWIERCTSPESICEAAGDDNDHRPADVALVETVQEILNVPVATIDTSPLPVGEAVVVAGYGCEGSVGGYWSYASSNLKAGVVQLLHPGALLHRGSSVTVDNLHVVADHDLITPGPAWPTPGPGLCPGDSGGPLFRAKGGGATVVGVNASYTFSGGVGAGLPVTNWHARLDTATPRNVGGWLATLGATTCAGDTCPTRAPAASLAAAAPAPAIVARLVSDGRDSSCQRAALDTSGVQAAIDDVLATNAFCMSLNGQRVALEEGRYTYGSVAWCSIQTQPTAAQAAAFTNAMEARGFAGFALQNGGVVGTIYSQACDAFPNGDAACRASLPSNEKIRSDVKFVSGTRSTCSFLAAPQHLASSGFDGYGVPFTCTLTSAPSAEVEAYIPQAMNRYPYTSVTYDASTDTLVGWAVGAPCATFAASTP